MIKMEKKFSKHWKSSKKPGKQRKYRCNAPLHIKQKFVHVHLSKELRNKYGMRSICLKKGDKVKIVRGNYKGKQNKVSRVDLKKSRVYVEGIDFTKKDGNKILYTLQPSNLMITELDIEDKKREAKLKKDKKASEVKK